MVRSDGSAAYQPGGGLSAWGGFRFADRQYPFSVRSVTRSSSGRASDSLTSCFREPLFAAAMDCSGSRPHIRKLQAIIARLPGRSTRLRSPHSTAALRRIIRSIIHSRTVSSTPPGSAAGLNTLIGQNAAANQRDFRSGYMQQWNFDIQQELGVAQCWKLFTPAASESGLPAQWASQLNQLDEDT